MPARLAALNRHFRTVSRADLSSTPYPLLSAMRIAPGSPEGRTSTTRMTRPCQPRRTARDGYRGLRFPGSCVASLRPPDPTFTSFADLCRATKLAPFCSGVPAPFGDTLAVLPAGIWRGSPPLPGLAPVNEASFRTDRNGRKMLVGASVACSFSVFSAGLGRGLGTGVLAVLSVERSRFLLSMLFSNSLDVALNTSSGVRSRTVGISFDSMGDLAVFSMIDRSAAVIWDEDGLSIASIFIRLMGSSKIPLAFAATGGVGCFSALPLAKL